MTYSGKILKCEFANVWTAPNTGDQVYFHTIEVDCGKEGIITGNIGAATKYDPKLAVHSNIHFTRSGNKLKRTEPENSENRAPARSQNRNSGYSGSSSNAGKYTQGKPESYLGFCMGYAKDLVVAGKAKPGDIKLFKEAADEIYAHLKTMLSADNE